MTNDRLRPDEDDLDLEEEILPNDGGVVELPDDEADEDDDFVDLDLDDDD
jgi:hypothetical protein